MTGYLAYGTAKSRITLYDSDGVTGLFRITLQREEKEGMVLTFTPEGVTTNLGSGASWANKRTHHGFRPSFSIKWAVGLNCTIEAWVTDHWDTATDIATPMAISKILNNAFVTPCLIEPRSDTAFSFLAQPNPEQAFTLKDIKGVAHTDLSIELLAVTITTIPDWAAL
jgi:hypothetical protein